MVSLQVQQIRTLLTFTFPFQQENQTQLLQLRDDTKCGASPHPPAPAAACFGGAGHFFLGYSRAHTASLRSSQNIAMPPQPPQTFFHDGAHEPFTHRGNCVVVEQQQQQRRFLRRGTKHCGPCVRVFVCARPRVWSGGKSDAVKWTTLPRFSFSIAPLPPCWLCLLLFLLFLLGLICRSQCLL